MIHSLVIIGDHFQVLVGDSKHGPMVDTTHLWDSAAGVAQVPEAPQLIGIPTARYGGFVVVEVEILPEMSNFDDADKWDLIGDFRLDVESGALLFWGPETEDLASAPRVVCEPGTYVGTSYSFGTSEITDEQLLEGVDRYRLRMRRT